MNPPTADEFHHYVDQRLLLPVLLVAHGHRRLYEVAGRCTTGLRLALQQRHGGTDATPTGVRTWLQRRPSSLQVSGQMLFTDGHSEPFGASVVPRSGRLLVYEIETIRFRHVGPRRPEPTIQSRIRTGP